MSHHSAVARDPAGADVGFPAGRQLVPADRREPQSPHPAAIACAPDRSRAYETSKRALDLVIGAIGLVVSIPIMVVLAAMIKMDSPGPALFRQQRLGKGGRPFTFYKFRTMQIDARMRFPELYAYRYTPDEVASMYFKVLDDPRLTRFGRHLRKTSLDELPNLFNVVRGEMTLVGPRPELPEMLPYYTPTQTMKFAVTPGLTGLAQVTGRSVLTFQQTISADVTYCLQRSFAFDLMILFRTVKTVVLRIGAF